MAGGRLGNLAHMLVDAPGIAEMKQVVIVAGTNDIVKDQESQDHHLFDRSTSLTVVGPPVVPDASIQRQIKIVAYDAIMKRLSRQKDFPFQFIPSPEGVDMEGIHPTKDWTKMILQAVHSVIPIIHNAGTRGWRMFSSMDASTATVLSRF